MKNRRKIQKIVEKYAQDSIVNGKINQKQVLFYSNEFKKLPWDKATVYLAEYIRALKRITNQYILYIETSTPLSTAQKNQVARSLKKEFTFTKIVNKIDPSILGGIRVKIGDHIYEDTLQSRVAQVGEFIHG